MGGDAVRGSAPETGFNSRPGCPPPAWWVSCRRTPRGRETRTAAGLCGGGRAVSLGIEEAGDDRDDGLRVGNVSLVRDDRPLGPRDGGRDRVRGRVEESGAQP